MKNNKLYKLSILLSLFLVFSCGEDFLEIKPKAALSSEDVQTAENAEELVIAAYAGMANDELMGSLTNMWAYGSVRSDDAYKAGGGLDDTGILNTYEQYNLTVADQFNDWFLPRTWTGFYKAISRANFALRVINNLSETDYPNKTLRQAELRFLRAHCHFMLKLIFKKVPYITEDLSAEQILKTSNDLSNEDLWDRIATDFLYAYDNLPISQDEVGRADKNAATAYLTKLRLYQAYEQNDQHQVTNINATRLQEVIDYADEVSASLEPDFGNNYLGGFDNGPESIWAAQFSINDGTVVGRVSYVTGLNSPHGNGLYGCCGFHYASQNMVNAFKTDTNGLPLFDTFNDDDIYNTPNMDGTHDDPSVTIDPRLDHTVGIPGRPFKYRNTVNEPGDMIYNVSWARDPGTYSYFGNMKEQQAPDCSCYVKEGPFIGTSKNIDFIRYADVLLWKAEALIQLNRRDEALPIINQIRRRAAASDQRPLAAGASNIYNVATYVSFPDKEYAWKALKFERRLEFAMEGPRFFDLVRWGEAADVLNAYLAVEGTKRAYLAPVVFTSGRDEYYPIPQREIDVTAGLYIQNPGY